MKTTENVIIKNGEIELCDKAVSYLRYLQQGDEFTHQGKNSGVHLEIERINHNIDLLIDLFDYMEIGSRGMCTIIDVLQYLKYQKDIIKTFEIP